EEVRNVMARDTLPLFSPGHPFLFQEGKTAFHGLTNLASAAKRFRGRLSSQGLAKERTRENNNHADLEMLSARHGKRALSQLTTFHRAGRPSIPRVGFSTPGDVHRNSACKPGSSSDGAPCPGRPDNPDTAP